MTEQEILADIIKGLAPDAVLFREHSGVFFNPNGSRITIGFKGKPDAIGLYRLTVTPEMVGKEVAVYCAFEVKKKGGKVREQQEKFVSVIRKYGAISGIIRSLDDAKNEISQYIKGLKKQ